MQETMLKDLMKSIIDNQGISDALGLIIEAIREYGDEYVEDKKYYDWIADQIDNKVEV